MSQKVYYIDHRVEKLIRAFEKKDHEASQAPKIHVRTVAGRAARLYEMLRNAVEYREEHLLRKAAIERILKRKFGAGMTSKKLALPLVEELIKENYIKNNSLLTSKIDEVAGVLNKYIHLFNRSLPHYQAKEKKKVAFWLLGIAAYEIDLALTEENWERALVGFMTDVMMERIVFKGRDLPEEKKYFYLSVAVNRALIRSDYSIISYYFLVHRYPDWKKGGAEILNQVSSELSAFRKEVEEGFSSVLTERLYRLMERHVMPFDVLRTMIQKDPEAFDTLLESPVQLEEAVKETSKEIYKKGKKSLRKQSVRSIIYIFLTKMLLALAIEVPYDLWIHAATLVPTPVIINITFPPLLMFLITLTIHIPEKKNTEAIVRNMYDLVYKYEEKNIQYEISGKQNRRPLLQLFFNIFYIATFSLTFGGLFYILRQLNFSILSMGIFVVFLSVISFFGVRLRTRAKQLIVLQKRENIFAILFDFLTLPILRLGRWLSVNFARVNVMAIFLDLIIEAPIKWFINFVDDWFSFLREKREEVY